MRVTDVPRTVLRLQYQLARFPLQVIGDQFVARLDDESPARLWYEGSLGRLDAVIGGALGDEALRRRGAARMDRSAALGRAARLDDTATERVQAADAELRHTREQAEQRQHAAQATTQQQVREARETTENRKRDAAVTAQRGTAAAKRQADEVAARRKGAARAAEEQDQARIRAAERQATAAAGGKGRAAEAKRAAAAAAETRADRLEDLARTEKDNR
ncbi:IF2 family translation initiation factor [Mycolicibacterium thermoresistibile]